MSAPARRVIRQSLHEALVAPLREMIVKGELCPGDKVPEEELCLRFGVSRTPLREAVKVLAAEGVLQILPHRGAIVAKITQTEIDELFPIMAALERLAAELACARATEREIARIRKLHDVMMAHYQAGNESAYLAHNRLIHEAIFDLAGNAALSAFFQQILIRTNACRFILRKNAEHWRQAMEEHEDIIKALEARDGKRLADLLDAHVRVTSVEIAHASCGPDAAVRKDISALTRKPAQKQAEIKKVAHERTL